MFATFEIISISVPSFCGILYPLLLRDPCENTKVAWMVGNSSEGATIVCRAEHCESMGEPPVKVAATQVLEQAIGIRKQLKQLRFYMILLGSSATLGTELAVGVLRCRGTSP